MGMGRANYINQFVQPAVESANISGEQLHIRNKTNSNNNNNNKRSCEPNLV